MNRLEFHADLDAFESALRTRLRGSVSRDRVTRGIYSTDASHYQVMPEVVVVPLDEADAVAAITTAGEFGVPIVPRGGGTSLSGQTTWTGMVIDFSKHLDQVLEVNVPQRWARVQPGVIRDLLNAELKPWGLHFAPDPATSSRANVGGMIGNNASGMHSVIYGKTIDHVISCKVALADGTVLQFAPTPPEEWQRLSAGDDRAAALYAGVQRIIDANRDEIERRYPKVMRRVSGYNLDAFLPKQQGGQGDDWNLTHLIVGSEGTLASLLEAKVRLEPLPNATALCIVHFADVIESLEAVDSMLAHRPAAIELLDANVLREAKRNPATAALTDFIEGEPGAIQIVEFFGDSVDDAQQRAQEMARQLKAGGLGYAWPVRIDPAAQARVWDVRRLGLGLIGNLKGARKGQAFIEDACIPTDRLADYIRRVLGICAAKSVDVVLYAHSSVGVIHTRPTLDLHNPRDVKLMQEIANEVFELVLEYGGAWSGEHGDGLLRGAFIPRFFGPTIYQALRQVKQLFDPHGLMNPGKIIDAAPMTENLRYGPQYRLEQVPSTYAYRDHGSFPLLVEQCSGVGACRKLNTGTMCPSYMATRDEEHTVRGRANALRLAMSGQLGPDALVGDRVHEVLELCLGCKACKSECPTLVDMARLKSDVLQMRYDRHGTPLAARMLGGSARTARMFAGPLAPLVNTLQAWGPAKRLLESAIGVDRRRSLPNYTRQTFARWFSRHQAGRPNGQGPRVALFNDTFTNCFEPHIGQAAVRLLEASGYEVELADVGCCQRTAISQGLLRHAQVEGLRTLERLNRFASAGVPILVLEPGCASALVDDLVDLVEDEALARGVAQQVKPIDQFLAQQWQAGDLRVTFRSPFEEILIHGHCHQKALFGTEAMKTLLSETEARFAEIDSGCCGMAGAFGYQHYELSRQIGEDRLFPAVRGRKEGTEVVACGISCRHQLKDFLNVQAKHWVETIEVVR